MRHRQRLMLMSGDGPHGISPTAQDVAEELVRLTNGFFGSMSKLTDEQVEHEGQLLIHHIIKDWNERFELGIKESDEQSG